MWTVGRRLFALFKIVVGVSLILPPGPGRWLRTSLGVYMFGSAAISFSPDPRLADGRTILGFSKVRGLRLMCASHIISGACVLIAAFTSGQLVLAWIVTPFVLTWMLLWSTALRECGRDDGRTVAKATSSQA